jgi:hypothetical protein
LQDHGLIAAGLVAGGIALLVGTGSSSKGGGTTPVVQARSGTYSGQTAQQFKISFTLTRKHQIDDIDFIEKVTCTRTGITQVPFAGLPSTAGPLGANGVFAVNVELPEQTFRMIGEYADGQFHGGFRHTFNADLKGNPTLATPPAQTCDSNQVTFTAKS